MNRIILVSKDVNYSKDILNRINVKYNNFQIVGIYTSIMELERNIEGLKFDFILINFNNICETIDKYEYVQENYDKVIRIDNSNISKEKILEDILVVENKIRDAKVNICYKKIKEELEFLEVNTDYVGFVYLVEIIKIIKRSKNKNDFNLKNIYEEIACKYGKKTSNIKSNLNYLVNQIYFDCEYTKINEYIGNVGLNRISTKSFIKAILNHIN